MYDTLLGPQGPMGGRRPHGSEGAFFQGELDSLFLGAVTQEHWRGALARLADSLQATGALLLSQEFGALDCGATAGTLLASAGTLRQVGCRDAAPLPDRVFQAGLAASGPPDPGSFFRETDLAEICPQRVLGLVLDHRGQRADCVLLVREPSAPPFGEGEQARLGALRPGLQEALKVWRLVEDARRAQAAAVTALEALSLGVVLLDGGGHPLSANHTAQEILAEGDGVKLGPEGLEATIGGRRRLLRSLLRQGSGAETGTGAPATGHHHCVRRQHRERPLSLVIVPLEGASAVCGPAAPAAVLYISDPEAACSVDESRLRELYGLTGAEARLAARLGAGERLAEAAEASGITYETARTHLKRLMGKVGVGRQADLVRVLTSGTHAFLKLPSSERRRR